MEGSCDGNVRLSEDKSVAFAKLVEVNEYSPVSVDAEWQAASGGSDASPADGDDKDDIQGNFLDLKRIDKLTGGKGTKAPREKSMLELIEECKSKNTTYETLMNTWKNSTAVINLYSHTTSQ